ncbi:hypothetical protein ACFWAA_36485 [Streptomyces sp. NPDC059922]|uniref:hypothetical protein n=1 Tax=Streptomyces sp. NPDC059922 TaxID=3347005 RepID=UPI00365B75CB
MEGDPARGPLAGRLAVAELHEKLLGAYRAGDIDSIVEKAHREIQTAVRDYVAQTGTLVNLHTEEELREHLQDFYAQYSVLGIEVVTRQFEDWYFFHELRWTVEARKGPAAGRVFSYHTAEFAEVTVAGLLTAHIGHGTDQIEVG